MRSSVTEFPQDLDLQQVKESSRDLQVSLDPDDIKIVFDIVHVIICVQHQNTGCCGNLCKCFLVLSPLLSGYNMQHESLVVFNWSLTENTTQILWEPNQCLHVHRWMFSLVHLQTELRLNFLNHVLHRLWFTSDIILSYCLVPTSRVFEEQAPSLWTHPHHELWEHSSEVLSASCMLRS